MEVKKGGIRMRLEADLHMHTVASGHAYSTVKEMAEAAAVRGLQLIGITDHGVNMPGGPHLYYFGNLKAIPERIAGVEILKGVEANIIDEAGTLDLPERLLTKLDLVLAGLHADTGYEGNTVEANTRAMIAAINNPYVHIIAHPGNPAYPVNAEMVVQAAKAAGKVLEINDSSLRSSRPGSGPRCQLFAALARRYGLTVAVNSDAHFYTAVGQCAQAMDLVLDAGISSEQVLNVSAARVKGYLLRQRARLEGFSRREA
jgi:putative hydrolase